MHFECGILKLFLLNAKVMSSNIFYAESNFLTFLLGSLCLWCTVIYIWIFSYTSFATDSPAKTPSNGANFNGSSSGGNFVQNETTALGVDENCQTIEGKHHLEHPTQTSTVSWTSEKSPSSSIFSRSFFIWFDQFVHWGQEKNLLSNNDDQAWNLDDGAR